MSITEFLIIVSIVCIAFTNLGCASLLVADYSKNEIKQQRCIKAVALDNGGAGVGVDLLSLDTLSQHPIAQLGAAVADALSIYAAYTITKNSTQTHTVGVTSGRDTIVIDGNGNKVSVGNSKTTTTGTGE